MLMLAGCGGYQTFAEAPSPDGARTALLTRPRGSMEPIYYSVRITGAETCVAATLEGYQAELWVRMEWTANDALTVRYGVPLGRGMKPTAPAAVTGEEACRNLRLTIVEDPRLAPPPTHNAPGYDSVQHDPNDPYKGGELPENSAQRGRLGADPAAANEGTANAVEGAR
jgi:hypothetical protein